MKVAVLCEFSGVVRDAFLRNDHIAMSFDLLPTESPGPHREGDILNYPFNYWKQFDLAICHPPCTYLCVSGNRWYAESEERTEALNFVKYLMLLPINKICIENPVSVISSFKKPDQCIQPYEFGESENKNTCLWLKNLPKLKPTKIIPKEERKNTVHEMGPSQDRGKLRSVFFKGIAEAMADQWGGLND